MKWLLRGISLRSSRHVLPTKGRRQTSLIPAFVPGSFDPYHSASRARGRPGGALRREGAVDVESSVDLAGGGDMLVTMSEE